MKINAKINNAVEKYVGRQYWIEENGVFAIAPIKESGYVVDQASVEKENVRRIIVSGKKMSISSEFADIQMANHSGDDWSGKFEWHDDSRSKDSGFVKVTMYRAKNKILLKGKWESGIGMFVWIVEAESVEHFPDEKYR